MAWLSQYSRESEGAGHPQELTSCHCVTRWAKAPKRRRLLVIDLRGLSSWGLYYFCLVSLVDYRCRFCHAYGGMGSPAQTISCVCMSRQPVGS
jgi:hypothetical protein